MNAVVLALLSFAAWRDLATRTIPDVVSVALFLLGAATRLGAGWQEFGWSLGIAALVFVLLVPFHAWGLVGGADVKLLAALAVGLPPLALYHLITATTLAGGLLALLYLLLRRPLRRARIGVARSGRARFLPLRIAAIEMWRIKRGAPLPYGLAIAAGAALVVLNEPGV